MTSPEATKRRPANLRRAWLLAVSTALLVACAPRLLVQPPGVPAPADFPEAYYQQARARGVQVLRVDPERSLVSIEVRRGGRLARLGHDHVVASHDVRGYVAVADGRADIYVPLDRLVVDEPALRAEAGFSTQPSPDAIDGTRVNMLTKVLETERFPFALIRISRRTADPQTLGVAITLHGTTRSLEVPARIEETPDGVSVSGKMSFKQSEFGIVPLAVLGGALLVEDRVDLRFRILASGR